MLCRIVMRDERPALFAQIPYHLPEKAVLLSWFAAAAHLEEKDIYRHSVRDR